MPELPRGAVAFLFTDIEGSTRLWQSYPEAMPGAYERHDAILRDVIAAQQGVAYKVIGDAFQAAFPTAPGAVSAALQAQRRLVAEDWGGGGLPEPLRIRTAVHVADIDAHPDGDYRSPALNRLGRLLAAGHGGQILISQDAAARLGDRLPPDADLRDLGERRLKDLRGAERIYQLLHPDLPTDFPPLATLDRRPHNLPVPPTPLLGREQEVRAIRQLLERRVGGSRLVTLTGPGGIGKTRLAAQVAAELVDVFNHGVFWVELATLSDADQVPAAIAQALEVVGEAGTPLLATLLEHLGERDVLLVLDNLEQLAAAPPLVAKLLAAAPGLRVLATSRERLDIRGERIAPVHPLTVPPPEVLTELNAANAAQYAAVRLFQERSQDAEPEFTLTDATAQTVARICSRLDGLPLAIELAAARTRLLSPDALLAGLEQRLNVLTAGARDLPERQQTMRAAIAWSYDLLDDDEQYLFRQLAVFGGGATLAAIEAVVPGEMRPAAGALDLVTALVAKSLVRQSAAGGESRFAMLETIREYGLEQLAAAGETDRVGAAHAAWLLSLAEAAEPELVGAEQGAWIARLEREHDNVRAAMEWALPRGDAEIAIRLGGALWRFWSERVHLSEGRGWLERALAAGDAGPAAVRAKGLYAAAVLAEDQGDYEQAVVRHEAALVLWQGRGDRRGVALALGSLGNIAHDRGDYGSALKRHEAALALARELEDRRLIAVSTASLGTVALYRSDLEGATRYYEESLLLFRALGDTHGTSRILENLGVVVSQRGDLTRAIALYEEALDLARGLGNPTSIASGLINLGAALHAAGNDDEAERLYEEARERLRESGDRRHTAVALGNLANIARGRGDLARAAALLGESLTLSAGIGDRVSSADCWVSLALIANEAGDPGRAVHLLGAAAALRDATGAPLGESPSADQARVAAVSRDVLGDAGFTAAWDAGRALSFDDAVAEALAVAESGAAHTRPEPA